MSATYFGMQLLRIHTLTSALWIRYRAVNSITSFHHICCSNLNLILQKEALWMQDPGGTLEHEAQNTLP